MPVCSGPPGGWRHRPSPATVPFPPPLPSLTASAFRVRLGWRRAVPPHGQGLRAAPALEAPAPVKHGCVLAAVSSSGQLRAHPRAFSPGPRESCVFKIPFLSRSLEPFGLAGCGEDELRFHTEEVQCAPPCTPQGEVSVVEIPERLPGPATAPGCVRALLLPGPRAPGGPACRHSAGGSVLVCEPLSHT